MCSAAAEHNKCLHGLHTFVPGLGYHGTNTGIPIARSGLLAVQIAMFVSLIYKFVNWFTNLLDLVFISEIWLQRAQGIGELPLVMVVSLLLMVKVCSDIHN